MFTKHLVRVARCHCRSLFCSVKPWSREESYSRERPARSRPIARKRRRYSREFQAASDVSLGG